MCKNASDDFINSRDRDSVFLFLSNWSRNALKNVFCSLRLQWIPPRQFKEARIYTNNKMHTPRDYRGGSDKSAFYILGYFFINQIFIIHWGNPLTISWILKTKRFGSKTSFLKLKDSKNERLIHFRDCFRQRCLTASKSQKLRSFQWRRTSLRTKPNFDKRYRELFHKEGRLWTEEEECENSIYKIYFTSLFSPRSKIRKKMIKLGYLLNDIS